MDYEKEDGLILHASEVRLYVCGYSCPINTLYYLGIFSVVLYFHVSCCFLLLLHLPNASLCGTCIVLSCISPCTLSLSLTPPSLCLFFSQPSRSRQMATHPKPGAAQGLFLLEFFLSTVTLLNVGSL